MVLTRVLSIDDANAAVDWRTIFLLAGLIPLGKATQDTGTAAWLANGLLDMIGDVSPAMLLTIVAGFSTLYLHYYYRVSGKTREGKILLKPSEVPGG
jgi:di/tricarboxylate transporter